MKTFISDLLNGNGSNYILPFFWQHGETEDVLREYMGVIHGCGIGAVCVEARPHPDFAGPGWWHDMDIILGGEVGGYLADHMITLGKKVMEYNGFDHDVRYLKNCSYKREASAVGVAKHFLQEFIKNI